ncbi:hypothetical protein H2201_009228, partial [Coniosporium apollinis]
MCYLTGQTENEEPEGLWQGKEAERPKPSLWSTVSTIDEEFDDGFITQVYNYLSLGYPSLARKFDEELSRISGTSITELRQDDALANARGYIRFGDDEN